MLPQEATASKNDLENAHNGMLCFLHLKILSLPLPHLIYAGTSEEVKASIIKVCFTNEDYEALIGKHNWQKLLFGTFFSYKECCHILLNLPSLVEMQTGQPGLDPGPCAPRWWVHGAFVSRKAGAVRPECTAA